MNNIYVKYLSLLPIFVLIQILILNEILFFSYINPYIYIVLILSLPLKTPKWFLLLYAFTIGFFIDLFSGNLGFHSTATVLSAFLKPAIAKLTVPHNIIGDNDEITSNKTGIKSFIIYTVLIVIVHNNTLFILEHFDLNFKIIGKIIASSFVTLILILVLEILKSNKK